MAARTSSIEITLTGTHEQRVEQLLRYARHHARMAQSLAQPRMTDALVALEEVLIDQLATLEHAREDDLADAEESGVAEQERRAWTPLRAA
jgi:gamma-glutamyl phosphate reductase